VLTLAAITVFLTYQYLSASREEVSVVVPVKDIEQGVRLDDSLLVLKQVPKEVKEDYFKDAFTAKEDVIGCVTKQKLSKGEPIMADPQQLVMGEELQYALTEDNDVNEAYFIPEDSRLVTIEVDNSGSINYSLKKGDYVDVIFSSVDESTGGLYSSLLLQHIQIYATEKVVTEDDEGIIAKKQSITLLATVEECLKLAAGNRNGILDLALNPLKGSTEDIASVSILSYSAEVPLTKEEKLTDLKNYIESFDMSEETRKQLLLFLDNERGKDALIEFIGATEIDEATKEKLLKLLGKDGK
jgi:Flp pilus assembly protein CpaB